MLCAPGFRDENRVIAFVQKIADRHPDAIVLSAGVGGAVYAVERAALARGLRVAAFRTECPTPGVGVTRRVEDPETGEFDPPYPTEPPRRFVALYELRPDEEGHRDGLWHPDPRHVQVVRGDKAAEEACVRWALAQADNVVAFTTDPTWPRHENVHRIGVA